jgi:phosphatidylglycerophosphate synthase
MIPPGPALGFVAVLGLLAVLQQGAGLGTVGWLGGLVAGAATASLLARGRCGRGAVQLGPADHVTLARAVLVCGVTAMVVGSVAGSAPGPRTTLVIVSLSMVALVLDAVDGAVARRTGTVSALGARFDMEVDALLILVLGVHVAADVGWWVLAIGGYRYALLAAATWAFWLRGQVPARRWRKAVAAVQGIVLTVGAAQLLADPVVVAALLVSLALLTASFGTEIAELWRIRHLPTASPHETSRADDGPGMARLRAGAGQWQA